MTSAGVVLSVRSSCEKHYSSPQGHTRPTRHTGHTTTKSQVTGPTGRPCRGPGLSPCDINRCLKRYIARELYQILKTHSTA